MFDIGVEKEEEEEDEDEDDEDELEKDVDTDLENDFETFFEELIIFSEASFETLK